MRSGLRPEGSHQPSEVFYSVNLRIAPPGLSRWWSIAILRTNRGWASISLEEKHFANTSYRRRLIPVLPGSPSKAPRAASIIRLFLDSAETRFGRTPRIRSKDLRNMRGESALPQDDSKTVGELQKTLTRPKGRRLTQVGDALKGRCDDERILPFHDSGNLFGFIRRHGGPKYRKLSTKLRSPR
jgi:hypothetical protein